MRRKRQLPVYAPQNSRRKNGQAQICENVVSHHSMIPAVAGWPATGKKFFFLKPADQAPAKPISNATLHAARRFGQTGQFARSLRRSGREELVELLHVNFQIFADLPDHRAMRTADSNYAGS
jgi:hypothetical protein